MIQEGGARKHSRAEQEHCICLPIHSVRSRKEYFDDL